MKIQFQMPDRKFLGGFAMGILWGIVITFIAGVVYLRHSMVLEYECKGNVEASVAKIKENASRMPAWTVQQSGCAVPIAPDGSKMDALRICNANYAKMLVSDPADRKVSAVIPCAVSIYEKPDGKTYLARLNMPLLARLLGGMPAQLFPDTIAPEQRYMMAGVLKVK